MKPANILVAKGGEAKLADFGIARVAADTTTRMTGQMTSGTLQYMSPEQYRGKRTDGAADQYSLAVTVYDLLTGKPPFHTGDIGYQIVNEEAEPVPGAPDYINDALLRALAKDRAKRFADCRSFAKALSGPPVEEKIAKPKPEVAVEEVAEVGSPVAVAGPLTGSGRGTRRIVWTVLLLFVLAGVVGGAWYFNRPDPQPSEPPVAVKTPDPPAPVPQASELASGSKKPTTTGVPPAVNIIPNESMPKDTPEKFSVMFETTKGDFAVEFHREWAPNGVDRIYELMMIKFFTDMRIFRVVEGFVAQFGISGDPILSRTWMNSNIPDDKRTQSNTEGMLTFAASIMPNSRSTQVFINLGDNSNLDGMGFAPVGKVIFGMNVVKSFYAGYGEKPSGFQERIGLMGNKFLDKEFPNLDSIKRAVFIAESSHKSADAALKDLGQESAIEKLKDLGYLE